MIVPLNHPSVTAVDCSVDGYWYDDVDVWLVVVDTDTGIAYTHYDGPWYPVSEAWPLEHDELPEAP